MGQTRGSSQWAIWNFFVSSERYKGHRCQHIRVVFLILWPPLRFSSFQYVVAFESSRHMNRLKIHGIETVYVRVDLLAGIKIFMSVLNLLRLEICSLDFVMGSDALFFVQTLLE